MIKIALGLCLTKSGISFLKISVFLCTRANLLSPSFCLAPAVMIIILDPAEVAQSDEKIERVEFASLWLLFFVITCVGLDFSSSKKS